MSVIANIKNGVFLALKEYQKIGTFGLVLNGRRYQKSGSQAHQC